LFHVHGLILGLIGPLRRGGTVRHLGRFAADEVAAELRGGAMLFAVPTMYHRLAAEVTASAELAAAVGRARLLVSGSAHSRPACTNGSPQPPANTWWSATA